MKMLFSGTVLIITLFLLLTFSFSYAVEKRGGIVLSFDDGYSSWIRTIAPELERVGGKATGFVNNQRIRFGDMSFKDLRTLQNTYGWEIGTHTYHHFNAPIFVQQKGLIAWIKDELDASFIELSSEGLKIHSMVFPYNASSKELGAEVMKKFRSFRRDEVYPINNRANEDGSIPGTEIDIGFYVPLTHAFKWIDFTLQQDKLLFLYGHKVLPDDAFITGKVASVSALKLVSKEKVRVPNEKGLCLVPDTRRRLYRNVKVSSIDGESIIITRGDLTAMSKADADFIVGPCYGIQLSYFRSMIEYAAARLPFYTTEQAIEKMQRAPK